MANVESRDGFKEKQATLCSPRCSLFYHCPWQSAFGILHMQISADSLIHTHHQANRTGGSWPSYLTTCALPNAWAISLSAVWYTPSPRSRTAADATWNHALLRHVGTANHNSTCCPTPHHITPHATENMCNHTTVTTLSNKILYLIQLPSRYSSWSYSAQILSYSSHCPELAALAK